LKSNLGAAAENAANHRLPKAAEPVTRGAVFSCPSAFALLDEAAVAAGKRGGFTLLVIIIL